MQKHAFYVKYALVSKICKIKICNIISLSMMKTHLLHVIAYKDMNMHYMQNPVFKYNLEICTVKINCFCKN